LQVQNRLPNTNIHFFFKKNFVAHFHEGLGSWLVW